MKIYSVLSFDNQFQQISSFLQEKFCIRNNRIEIDSHLWNSTKIQFKLDDHHWLISHLIWIVWRIISVYELHSFHFISIFVWFWIWNFRSLSASYFADQLFISRIRCLFSRFGFLNNATLLNVSERCIHLRLFQQFFPLFLKVNYETTIHQK